MSDSNISHASKDEAVKHIKDEINPYKALPMDTEEAKEAIKEPYKRQQPCQEEVDAEQTKLFNKYDLYSIRSTHFGTRMRYITDRIHRVAEIFHTAMHNEKKLHKALVEKKQIGDWSRDEMVLECEALRVQRAKVVAAYNWQLNAALRLQEECYDHFPQKRITAAIQAIVPQESADVIDPYWLV